MPETSEPRLDLSALRDTMQQALAPLLGSELSIELGFPALPADITRAFPHVIVALGLADTREANAPQAWLCLDSALATNLVDRALGGRGQLGVASAATLLSEAECGVLAYLAARVARVLPGLWIRDSYAVNAALPPAAEHWPITLRWSHGTGVLRLGWPAPASSCVPAQLGWFDHLSASERDALAVGDLLTLDALALSVTTAGLAGPGSLRVSGIDDALHVLLDGAQLQGRRVRARSGHVDEVFVAHADLSLTPAALARLAAGETIEHARGADGAVRLFHGTRELARGRLVQISGVVGMQIDALS